MIFDPNEPLTSLEKRYLNDIATYLSQFPSYYYDGPLEGPALISLYDKLNHLAHLPDSRFSFFNPSKAFSQNNTFGYTMESTRVFLEKMEDYL